MSIDTYRTMAMVRPDKSGQFNLDWIEKLARSLDHGVTVTRRSGDDIVVSRAGASLDIHFQSGPIVIEESAELTEDDDVDCAGCSERFEIEGTDLDLALEAFHESLCARLHESGDFIVYSGLNGPYADW